MQTFTSDLAPSSSCPTLQVKEDSVSVHSSLNTPNERSEAAAGQAS